VLRKASLAALACSCVAMLVAPWAPPGVRAALLVAGAVGTPCAVWTLALRPGAERRAGIAVAGLLGTSLAIGTAGAVTFDSAGARRAWTLVFVWAVPAVVTGLGFVWMLRTPPDRQR